MILGSFLASAEAQSATATNPQYPPWVYVDTYEGEALKRLLVKDYRPRAKKPWEYESNATYLIVAAEEFLSDGKPDNIAKLAELAAWKRSKGYNVIVKSLRVIGMDNHSPTVTSQDVHRYIRGVYAGEGSQSYPLRYVLLVGECHVQDQKQCSNGIWELTGADVVDTSKDRTSIPTVFSAFDLNDAKAGGIATDQPYAYGLSAGGFDDPDYRRYEGVVVGRISVDTKTECAVVIDKILNYERHPEAGGGWYKRFLGAFYFQDQEYGFWNPNKPDWCHVALVFSKDATNQTRTALYWNGYLIKTYTARDESPYPARDLATKVRIGRRLAGNAHVLSGEIDDVALYSSALAPAQIMRLANPAVRADKMGDPGLEAYWSFDGSEAGEDASGHKRHGVVKGPDWTPVGSGHDGKGRALSFDGKNDYFDVDLATPLYSDTMTISLWFKPVPASRDGQCLIEIGTAAQNGQRAKRAALWLYTQGGGFSSIHHERIVSWNGVLLGQRIEDKRLPPGFPWFQGKLVAGDGYLSGFSFDAGMGTYAAVVDEPGPDGKLEHGCGMKGELVVGLPYDPKPSARNKAKLPHDYYFGGSDLPAVPTLSGHPAWQTGDDHDSRLQSGVSGARVPDWVTEHFYKAHPDTSDIRGTPYAADKVNEIVNERGASIMLFTGHGSVYRSGSIRYTQEDLLRMHNGNRTPIALILMCSTGGFADKISPVCFTEALVKHPNGGCVGAVGASTGSNSAYTCSLGNGFVSAIFGRDFDPQRWAEAGMDGLETSADNVDWVTHRPAVALLWAKAWAYRWRLAPGLDNTEKRALWLQMNWFGDPEMLLRTDVPQELHVTNQSVVSPRANGTSTVAVTVTANGVPVPSARVAITHPNSALRPWTSLTNEQGKATLSLVMTSGTPYKPVTCRLVVTGYNLIPHEGDITLRPPG